MKPITNLLTAVTQGVCCYLADKRQPSAIADQSPSSPRTMVGFAIQHVGCNSYKGPSHDRRHCEPSKGKLLKRLLRDKY
jgi:hypothetical protein